MRFYRVPGITLARIQGFEVVEQGVYGVTSAETGEPVDESTLFQAGGMGAPLVDIAVLRLAAQGTIDLNRPANDYLKSWKIPESALTAAHRITVADLLRGTSGLTQNKFTGYPPGVPRPTLAALLNGADPHEMEPVKVRSEPGSRPISAGINRALLELLLTDVTGLPFDDLMRKWVFLPLGMAHSSYRPEPDANGACRIAPGHYASGDLTLDRYHVYPEQGESGLWTTAADFARALCQVLRMLNGRPNAILGADHLDLLRSVASDTMVLGLMRDRDGSLYRGGDSYGYYAELNVNSERGYGVVVMQNRMASWKLYNEIVKAVGQRNGWSR
jgi:CubicO group peptidase (beta-lactamase class C family)